METPSFLFVKESILSLKKVAFLFFKALGGLHIVSGLMVSNNYFLPSSSILNKVLDIPFAMVALIYAFLSIHIPTETEAQRKKAKIYQILMICTSLLVFLGLICINLVVPDRIA
jgi:hypothetical protein